MALLHIALSQVDEARLQALITGGAAESRTIDYKRTTYGNANADYSEFLADISSFANTSGGDLVLGMDAANGIPTALTPLTIPMDPEILRLEQVARGGLQPRIANIAFHAVLIQAGGNVLIIRVPRSYNPPHRIIRQGSNRFWARSAAGKYEPDVNELRVLFNAGALLAEKVRNFRLDRIAKIAAGEAPVQLMNRGSVVLHIVPLSAFDVTSTILPLGQIERSYNTFVPMGSRTASGARINFDGILKTSNADEQAAQHRAYVQLYRNGIIETVDSSVIARASGGPIITGLDDNLISETIRSLKDLARVGVEPPYALLVSLFDVAGARFHLVRDPADPGWRGHLGRSLERDQYHFDEVIFETVPTSSAECADVMRSTLDQIANTGGTAASPVFDQQGRYIPLAR
jgi:Putative DNA-binding domain